MRTISERAAKCFPFPLRCGRYTGSPMVRGASHWPAARRRLHCTVTELPFGPFSALSSLHLLIGSGHHSPCPGDPHPAASAGHAARAMDQLHSPSALTERGGQWRRRHSPSHQPPLPRAGASPRRSWQSWPLALCCSVRSRHSPAAGRCTASWRDWSHFAAGRRLSSVVTTRLSVPTHTTVAAAHTPPPLPPVPPTPLTLHWRHRSH